MTDMSTIEKIGFKDGSFLTIEELPSEMQVDVQRYNKWTVELGEVVKTLAELQDRYTLITYARAGAYNAINQAATQLQSQLEEQSNETSAPAITDQASGVDSKDPQ